MADTASAPASAAAPATDVPGVTDPNYAPPEGYLGNLTAAQQETLDKFRSELKESGIFIEGRMDDALLLRFLRARKWNIPAAKEMLAKTEEWRKKEDVDNIANFDFSEKIEVDKYYPKYYHKMDKAGRPVYIEVLGKLNTKELKKITTKDRQIKALVKEYEKFTNERLPACSKAVGHPVETCTTILDLNNVGLMAFYEVSDYIAEAANIGQNYYPERMGKFYIINAPMMFSGTWTVVKRWLDPVTVSKIKIIGRNKDTVRKELLEEIPAENLPVEFGGMCQCAGGCSLSDAGPWNVQST